VHSTGAVNSVPGFGKHKRTCSADRVSGGEKLAVIHTSSTTEGGVTNRYRLTTVYPAALNLETSAADTSRLALPVVRHELSM